MHRLLYFVIPFSLFLTSCKDDSVVTNQQTPVRINKKDFYVTVDSMPMPVGGISAILSKVVYPPEAKSKNIQGKVLIQSYIGEDGSVIFSEVMKSADSLLDKAAIDAINSVKFTPGYKSGKPVKTQVVIPVVFKLDGDHNKNPELKKEGNYYIQATEMPDIIGGFTALASKIKYPEAEKKNGTQGKVFIQVYINEKGEIEKKEISRGVNKNLDKAALDALNGIRFTPGKVNGKPVKTMVTIPIVFRLQ